MSEPTKLIDREALIKALEKWVQEEKDRALSGYHPGTISALYMVIARLRDGRLP